MAKLWSCPYCGELTRPADPDEVNDVKLVKVLCKRLKRAYSIPVIVKYVKCGVCGLMKFKD